MAVVRFDDLDVVAGRQRLRRHFKQLERHVDADAHVGRHDDRDVLGEFGNLGLLGIAEARRADDDLDTQLTADGEMRHRAFGAGEVDQYLRVFQACAQVRHDLDAACSAEKGCGIGPQRIAFGPVQRAGQLAVVGMVDGFDQHVPHATGGTRDGDAVERLRRHHLDSSGG